MSGRFLIIIMPTDEKTFAEVLKVFYEILVLLIPVLVGCAVLLFFWGLAKFVYSAGDEAALKKGKTLMFWGIIGIFVIVSVWGILSLLTSSFGWDFVLPQLPTS